MPLVVKGSAAIGLRSALLIFKTWRDCLFPRLLNKSLGLYFSWTNLGYSGSGANTTGPHGCCSLGGPGVDPEERQKHGQRPLDFSLCVPNSAVGWFVHLCHRNRTLEVGWALNSTASGREDTACLTLALFPQKGPPNWAIE
jgi:hypothetical protein